MTPGEPPRTSTWSETYFPNANTVQPVGPSAYSATPISRPGKSTSSQRFASISVRGFGRSASFEGRASFEGASFERRDASVMRAGASRLERRADLGIGRDAHRDRREYLGGEHRVGVSEIRGGRLAHDVRVSCDRLGAHRKTDVVRGRDLRDIAEVGRRQRETPRLGRDLASLELLR